jgi:hypothetical protein
VTVVTVASILALIGLLFWLRRRRRRRARVEPQESDRFDLFLDSKGSAVPGTTQRGVPHQMHAPMLLTGPSALSPSFARGTAKYAPVSDAAAVGTPIAAVPTPALSGERRRQQREQCSEPRSATTAPNDALSPSSPGTDCSLDPEARYRHTHDRNLSNSTGIRAPSSSAPLYP